VDRRPIGFKQLHHQLAACAALCSYAFTMNAYAKSYTDNAMLLLLLQLQLQLLLQ
jgi:hypothetical protein